MKKSNKKFLGVLLGLCILGGSTYGIYEFSTNSNSDDTNITLKEANKIASETDEKYFSDVSDKTYKEVETFMSDYYKAMNTYGKDDIDKFRNNFMSDDLSKLINTEGVIKNLEEYRNANKKYTFNGEIMYVKNDTKEKDIYVGVREWSDITTKNDVSNSTTKIGGVYILKKNSDGLIIDLILDSEEEFVVGETVNLDE